LKRKYKENLIQKLDELSGTDPKQYWNIVEELQNISGINKPNPSYKLSLKEWNSYFSSLN
jgi:hypothetical protein